MNTYVARIMTDYESYEDYKMLVRAENKELVREALTARKNLTVSSLSLSRQHTDEKMVGGLTSALENLGYEWKVEKKIIPNYIGQTRSTFIKIIFGGNKVIWIDKMSINENINALAIKVRPGFLMFNGKLNKYCSGENGLEIQRLVVEGDYEGAVVQALVSLSDLR